MRTSLAAGQPTPRQHEHHAGTQRRKVIRGTEPGTQGRSACAAHRGARAALRAPTRRVGAFKAVQVYHPGPNVCIARWATPKTPLRTPDPFRAFVAQDVSRPRARASRLAARSRSTRSKLRRRQRRPRESRRFWAMRPRSLPTERIADPSPSPTAGLERRGRAADRRSMGQPARTSLTLVCATFRGSVRESALFWRSSWGTVKIRLAVPGLSCVAYCWPSGTKALRSV